MTTDAAERVDRPVVHGLDVVAVGVEHEGRVVAGVVVPLARRAVVGAAGGERGRVEAVDRLAVGRLEREVQTDRRLGPSSETYSSSAQNAPSRSPPSSRPSARSTAA